MKTKGQTLSGKLGISLPADGQQPARLFFQRWLAVPVIPLTKQKTAPARDLDEAATLVSPPEVDPATAELPPETLSSLAELSRRSEPPASAEGIEELSSSLLRSVAEPPKPRGGSPGDVLNISVLGSLEQIKRMGGDPAAKAEDPEELSSSLLKSMAKPPPVPGKAPGAGVNERTIVTLEQLREIGERSAAAQINAPPENRTVELSVGELEFVGDPAKPPPPRTRAAAVPTSNSVIQSLADIQKVEQDRVAADKAAEEERKRVAAENAAGEERKRKEELAPLIKTLIGTLKARMDAESQRINDECDALAVEELLAMEDDGPAEPAVEAKTSPGMSIPVMAMEVEAGLPWVEHHTTAIINDQERDACESALPEKEVRWILPVPDFDDPAAQNIFEMCKEYPWVMLKGKKYFVINSEEGYKDSRKVARVGNQLHLWYEPSAEIDLAVDIVEDKEKDWPENLRFLTLKPEEIQAYGDLLREDKPVWLHPVPDADTQIDSDKWMVEECARRGIPKVSLGGNEYYMLPVTSVSDWCDTTMSFPKARIASRNGEWLSVWDQDDNGKIFFETHLKSYGPEGHPLPPGNGKFEPYESEKLDVSVLYHGKAKKWLYPLPVRLDEIESLTLNILVQIANREMRDTQATPLISLRGRWYFATNNPLHGSRLTSYDGSRVCMHKETPSSANKLAELRDRLAEKRLESQPALITLPTDIEQRKALLELFPEHVVKYLYFVGPENQGYEPHRPHIYLFRGNERERYLVLDEPFENAIAVVRRSDRVYQANV